MEVEGIEEVALDGTVYVRPNDQLDLTPEELKEPIPRVLTTANPTIDLMALQYDYQKCSFEPVKNIDHTIVFLSKKANLVPLDAYFIGSKIETPRTTITISDAIEISSKYSNHNKEQKVGEEKREENEDNADQTSPPAVQEEVDDGPEDKEEFYKEKFESNFEKKKLKNQFDFIDRGSQTFYMRPKHKETMTEKPPILIFSDNVTQWVIYDAYQKDFEAQEMEKNKEKKTISIVVPNSGKITQKHEQRHDDILKATPSLESTTSEDMMHLSYQMLECVWNELNIIEKMIQVNMFNDIALDFKFYEDEADEYIEDKGTLLPLWRFRYRTSGKLVVTSITWNPKYSDLFGCSFGSYNFQEQSTGQILFFALTKPSFPEYAYITESGVMSLKINVEHPFLIVVGLYDGNVSVYKLNEATHKPWITSSFLDKHTDPVWEISWLDKDLNGNLCFASLSSDGLALLWTIIKNRMQPERMMTFYMIDFPLPDFDGTQIEIRNGGLTFDFHSTKRELYIVGTKEGDMHVCSTDIMNAYLNTYKAHRLNVYKVQWNYYHPNICISCSADWTIKIWDISFKTKEPMFAYDLGCAVEDVAWAPYSSTVFAAVTTNGKVYVFNLRLNKTEPLCEQTVTTKKKNKLTKISFNPQNPIINIGDNRGTVNSFKLSPNLWKPQKEKKKFVIEAQHALTAEEKEKNRREMEYQNLENIISMARLGAKIVND